MAKSGYLYVIEAEENICKVGMTKYLPAEKVEKTWSRKFHKPFKLVAVYPCDNILRSERAAHELLRDYRGLGEWFHLSGEKICELINTLIDNPELEEKLIDAMEGRKKLGLSFRLTYDLLNEIEDHIEKLGTNRQEWLMAAVLDKLRN